MKLNQLARDTTAALGLAKARYSFCRTFAEVPPGCSLVFTTLLGEPPTVSGRRYVRLVDFGQHQLPTLTMKPTVDIRKEIKRVASGWSPPRSRRCSLPSTANMPPPSSCSRRCRRKVLRHAG